MTGRLLEKLWRKQRNVMALIGTIVQPKPSWKIALRMNDTNQLWCHNKPAQAAKKAWDKQCVGHDAFDGMVFNSIFKWRLKTVSLHHYSKESRAADDLKAFKHYQAKCPIHSHIPCWKRVQGRKVDDLKPHQFKATRPDDLHRLWALEMKCCLIKTSPKQTGGFH